MKCPAQLCSSQKNAQKLPPPTTSTTNDPPKVAPPTPVIPEDRPVKPSNVPLKPVEPIQIPKPNEDERLKQLESPETVELIKTFEIPDPVTEKPEAPAKQPTPPIVAVKPQPIVMPEPVKPVTSDPSDSLFNPAGQQTQTDKKTNKGIKEATTDFLAQEHDQPKKSSKRYTKSRQKNNHS